MECFSLLASSPMNRLSQPSSVQISNETFISYRCQPKAFASKILFAARNSNFWCCFRLEDKWSPIDCGEYLSSLSLFQLRELGIIEPKSDGGDVLFMKSGQGVAGQDEQALILKKKASNVAPKLKGTNIYLIGMMGSGKTTIGKLMAEALNYKFIDSDKLIEDAAGGLSIAQFFKEKDEETFRAAETEVLRQVSQSHRTVVATGGGIVVRNVNWTYLRKGITVWIDVPVDALAERVIAAGAHSRPLLGEMEGNSAFDQAKAKLSSILEFRDPFYKEADVVVSLKKLASDLRFGHVRDITPLLIAIQVTEEINKYMVKENCHMDNTNLAI